MEDKTPLLFTILEILSPIITAFLGWVSVRLAGWIKAKTKNEQVGGILARLTESTFCVVREAEQTFVKGMKAAKDPSSPGGTSLTEKEAEDIKRRVVAKVKDLWGPRGLKEARKVLGLDEGGVGRLIESKVEEAVHIEKPTAESKPKMARPKSSRP